MMRDPSHFAQRDVPVGASDREAAFAERDIGGRGFELVGGDLNPVTASDFAGKRLVLNIFPSLDTGVCAASGRYLTVSQ